MRAFKTEGIIIKRKNFGEADRIITVLTKSQGKIQVKAAGVRKITSHRSPHVELLNNSIIYIYKGRGAFPVLTEAQTIKDFSTIKEDLTKIGFAYHLCELIDGLCAENQENISVFNLFLDTLNRLQRLSKNSHSGEEQSDDSRILNGTDSGQARMTLNEDDIVSVIHEFEVELLTLLGFWPNNRTTINLNTQYIIENILERKLKSKSLINDLNK